MAATFVLTTLPTGGIGNWAQIGTNVNPDNTTMGLKSGTSFSISGVYDLIHSEAGYGIRLANTDGAVRSMVASGFGAGIVRMDQALQAERQGELKLWKGWRGHTWICWAAPPRRSAAVEALRQAVLEAWR